MEMKRIRILRILDRKSWGNYEHLDMNLEAGCAYISGVLQAEYDINRNIEAKIVFQCSYCGIDLVDQNSICRCWNDKDEMKKDPVLKCLMEIKEELKEQKDVLKDKIDCMLRISEGRNE